MSSAETLVASSTITHSMLLSKTQSQSVWLKSSIASLPVPRRLPVGFPSCQCSSQTLQGLDAFVVSRAEDVNCLKTLLFGQPMLVASGSASRFGRRARGHAVVPYPAMSSCETSEDPLNSSPPKDMLSRRLVTKLESVGATTPIICPSGL